MDGDGLQDILVGTATSRKHFDVEASVGTGKYDDLKDLCHEQGWYGFPYYQTAFELQREKTGLQGFLRSDTNWAVQSQKLARSLIFRI